MKPNWFAAFPIPAQDWLPETLKGLPEQCLGFQVEDIHMTIAFFRAMDPSRAQDVIQFIKTIQAKPFEIQLGSVLTLPTPKRFSALAFSLSTGREKACEYIGAFRDGLSQAAHTQSENRPPLAHITIARPKRKYGPGGQRVAREWASKIKPAKDRLLVDRIALYTWSEDRQTRQFQKVYERTLED